jgi:hypothetical protein
VDTSVSFSTEDRAAHYNVSWAWGDGTADRARAASASNGGGSAGARHSYSAPGIYTVTANVADQAGNIATVSRRVVVHAASSGIIGGAGTVVVPAATVRSAPVPGGAAHFSFVTPATGTAKAASAKSGFLFSLPGMSFASTDVRVFAAHAGHAQLVGTGTINGAGSYDFTATVAGGSADAGAGRFGVKISHTDPNTSAQVVDYDSQQAASGSEGRPVVEGKIVVQ